MYADKIPSLANSNVSFIIVRYKFKFCRRSACKLTTVNEEFGGGAGTVSYVTGAAWKMVPLVETLKK